MDNFSFRNNFSFEKHVHFLTSCHPSRCIQITQRFLLSTKKFLFLDPDSLLHQKYIFTTIQSRTQKLNLLFLQSLIFLTLLFIRYWFWYLRSLGSIYLLEKLRSYTGVHSLPWERYTYFILQRTICLKNLDRVTSVWHKTDIVSTTL